jgi:hypothetical protein
MEILLAILGFTVLIAIGGVYAASKAPPSEKPCECLPRYCCRCGREMVEHRADTDSVLLSEPGRDAERRLIQDT